MTDDHDTVDSSIVESDVRARVVTNRAITGRVVAESVGSKRSLESDNIAADASSVSSFGHKCNEYVDVIQQALDLALGNTGNFAPDSAVVEALDELYITARRAQATDLLRLLVPLHSVLRSAEQASFTLSQADTLLVQEAIIAITLGIDSIVNQKPAPDLLSDVTQRMVDVAAENKHEIRANSEATGLVNVFVADADELLQRLFEQTQRWRVSAGSSRSYEEVSRLLSSLHNGADNTGLTSIATVVQLLIRRMRALQVRKAIPDAKFFDIAIETIETLGEDLDRIRNNEQLIEHTDLYARLEADTGDSASAMLIPAERINSERTDLDSAAGNKNDSRPQAPHDAYNPAFLERTGQDSTQRGSSTHLQSNIEAATTDAHDHAEHTVRRRSPVSQHVQSAGSGYRETMVADVSRLDTFVENQWPDRRELVDMLRELSRSGESIKERVEQLRRTVHLYPDINEIAPEFDTENSASSVSPIDTIFFKIDSLLSAQRKSVTKMASALGLAEQRTVEVLGSELEKHVSASVRSVEYLNGAQKVVIDGQLYEHLRYVLRIILDSALSAVLEDLTEPDIPHEMDLTGASDITEFAVLATGRLVFDLIDEQLSIKVVGPHFQINNFVLSNASLRRVDEQMLKTPLPGWNNNRVRQTNGLIRGEPGVAGDVRKVAGDVVNTTDRHNDLVTLEVFQRFIDIAVFFQGRVTTAFTDQSTDQTMNDLPANPPVSAVETEMTLPVAAVSEELMLIKKGERLYGVQTSVIEKIEGNGTGVIESNHPNNPQKYQQDAVRIHCKTSNGSSCVLQADTLVGRQTVSVTKNYPLMLNKGYLGGFVFRDSTIALVINADAAEGLFR